MKYYSFGPNTSVKKLINLGLNLELSLDKKTMRIKFSDKDIIKYECELLEQDYPKDFPETESILELNWNKPVKRRDSRLSYFSSSQSEDLIYGYFQYGFLASVRLELFEVKFYRL